MKNKVKEFSPLPQTNVDWWENMRDTYFYPEIGIDENGKMILLKLR